MTVMFTCTNCGASYYSASPLRYHYRQECDQCGGPLAEAEHIPARAYVTASASNATFDIYGRVYTHEYLLSDLDRS